MESGPIDSIASESDAAKRARDADRQARREQRILSPLRPRRVSPTGAGELSALRRAWEASGRPVDREALRWCRLTLGPRRLLRALAVPWERLSGASRLSAPSVRVLSRAKVRKAKVRRRGMWGALERWAERR